MKAFLWFLAAAFMFMVLIGIWMINDEFVADTLEAFDTEPTQGWSYWRWRESWPALAFGVFPCLGISIFCIVKGFTASRQRS